MEIPTETCTHDLKKKNVDLQLYYSQQLRQFRSFRYGGLVLLFFYANVTVLMVKIKYDRFLQVVAKHETIIWQMLF